MKSKNPSSDFYTEILDKIEKRDFKAAADIEGLDNEIALLRVKIKEVLDNDPEDIKTILAAVNLLTKLIKTRNAIFKDEKKGLGEAIGNIIKDIGVPLGVASINKKM